jgi:hypothetical protein
MWMKALPKYLDTFCRFCGNFSDYESNAGNFIPRNEKSALTKSIIRKRGKTHIKITMENKRAILLLSGGIDSTTLLAKLSSENYDVIAVSFHYGQKHGIELNYAKKNAEKYDVKKHHIIELDKMLFKSSALVNREIDIATYENNELPKGQVNAYVPFRNLLFISTALSLAETMKIDEVYLAFNSDDSCNFLGL